VATRDMASVGEVSVRRPRLKGLPAVRDYGIVISFVALFVTLSIASPVFLSKANLLNILDQNAALGIVACAGTLVIIAGGFDLSVGATFALSSVVAAKVAGSTSVEIGMLLGCLTGLGVGLVNGLLVTVGRINSFIGTLATSIALRGLALVLTGGVLIRVADPSFTHLGQDSFLGIKLTVYFLAVAMLVFAVLLNRTVFGRKVFATGGNEEAARLSGVRVGGVRIMTFALSGLAAGLAGVLEASRVATGQADAGTGLELAAIAAIVLGGTSILGGEGAVWRTILGVLLLAMIGNGFNLLNVDPMYQQIVQGAIILLAVGTDAWVRRST
jgi:ribose transport system permease protein